MKQPKEARSVEELIDIVRQGAKVKYVFFWGHTPQIPGQIDHSCLSNWFPAQFSLDGIDYPTTEHHMMAEKARLFEDQRIEKQIISAKTPGKAKKLGRKVSGFDNKTWEKHRFEIVVNGNIGKFSQNKEMGNLLKITGSKVLVEASPRDRIWGIGMSKSNPDIEKPETWKGLNLLGFALMEVRKRLFE